MGGKKHIINTKESKSLNPKEFEFESKHYAAIKHVKSK